MKSLTYFFFVLVFLLGAAFFLGTTTDKRADAPLGKQSPSALTNVKYIRIAGVEVAAEEEKIRGLSGKEGLGENEGMLFIYDKPGEYVFWMKDMKFPIDIIWLAPIVGSVSEFTVVYIKEDARPESFPESFGAGTSAQYILEVASGFSKNNNLKVGDRVEFSL